MRIIFVYCGNGLQWLITAASVSQRYPMTMTLSLPTYSSALDLPKTIRTQTGVDCELGAVPHSFQLQLGNSDWFSQSDRLRPGLTLSVLKADLHKRFHLVAEAQECSLLRFTFCLSGSLSVNYRSAPDTLNISVGQGYLSALDGQVQLTSEFAAQQSLLLIRIDIDPLVFHALVGARFKAISSKIRAIAMGR
ncbi:MAG: hypothetical protein AAFY72_00225, partial [Cyanobacteria bacterium J06649_4]